MKKIVAIGIVSMLLLIGLSTLSVVGLKADTSEKSPYQGSVISATLSTTLSGYVYDNETNDPIAGVKVEARTNNVFIEYTNSQGYYYIDFFDGSGYVGDAYMTVSKNGYETHSEWVDLETGESNTKDFYLEPGEYIPEPDLQCDGSLSWTNVKPGSTVTGEFTVSNVGDSGSELDWKIKWYPYWGEWTFTPSSGNDLKPEDGAITVQVEIKVDDVEEFEFTGDVEVVNRENEYQDSCKIPVSLTTSKEKASISPVFLRFLDQIQNTFLVIRTLIQALKH